MTPLPLRAALAIAVAAAGAPGALAQGAAACTRAAPPESLMTAGYDEFDRASEPRAWRTLLAAGCVEAAMSTLDAYRTRNAALLSGEQRSEISFHLGQALALSGRDAEALPYFEAAPWAGATEEWAAYVEATIAFLRKDRPRLEAAAARYSSADGAGAMRVAVIRGFVACLDRPYAHAMHCAMQR